MSPDPAEGGAPAPDVAPAADPAPVVSVPPAAKPPVWPAFVGFAAAFGVTQVVGTVVLGVMLVLHLRQTGGFSAGLQAILQSLPAFIASPSVIVASAAASSSSLFGTALVGARLAKTKAVVRLRLGPSPLGVGKTVLAALGGVSVSWLFGALIEQLHLQDLGLLHLFDNAFSKASPGVYVLAFVFVGLCAPVAEETFFRGFMQTRLAQRWPRWGAIAMTAAAFGLMHLDPVQGPMAMLVGLYLGWLTERTGSIRPAIAAHAANNCFSVIATRYLRGDVPDAVGIGIVVLAAALLIASVLVLRARKPRVPVSENAS